MPQSRASFTSVLRAVCATLILLVQTHSCGGQPQVIGPQKIVAMLGDDVILPCHLEPVVDAVSMTLEWARPDLTPRFVFVWLNRQEMWDKHPSYKGRTSVSIDELRQGNISLRLSNVTLSDEGKYRCFVPMLDTQTNIELVIAAASSPVISLLGIDPNSRTGMLECESAGWYPEPEVLWLDAEGNIISAGPTETLRGPDGLYTVRSSVTVINKHANTFTCKLRQNKTNQARETQIHIQDDFFMVSCRPVGSNAIVASVCLLFILTVCFVLWKYRQTKPKGTDGREGEKEQLIKEMQKNKDVEQKKKGLEQENKDLKTELANVAKQLQDMAGRTESAKKNLVDMLPEQKNLTEKLMIHRAEMQKLLDENKTKVQDKEIKEKGGDKTANRAKAYESLKEIMLESRDKLEKKLNDDFKLDGVIEDLLVKTDQVINEITERDKELENNKQ
ncbi:butyrophilin subfamily 3 member A2-like [Genypterus blacodes]|uniref:butyrophilin subfamily 3 member A2-like n=1 Tax=Genypterus blacodes TaxID=154954 RepID=UPI003F76A236